MHRNHRTRQTTIKFEIFVYTNFEIEIRYLARYSEHLTRRVYNSHFKYYVSILIL
mgnify:CR=1 FL=1